MIGLDDRMQIRFLHLSYTSPEEDIPGDFAPGKEVRNGDLHQILLSNPQVPVLVQTLTLIISSTTTVPTVTILGILKCVRPPTIEF